MSDLISRQAAIDVINKIFPADPMRNDYTEGITCGAALAKEYIKQLPSAEPEIIRCKDCKWCVEHCDTDGNAPYWICKNWDGGTDADGFCYEAERKNDE